MEREGVGEEKAGVFRRTASKLNDVSPRNSEIFLHLVMGGRLWTAVQLLRSSTCPTVGWPRFQARIALEYSSVSADEILCLSVISIRNFWRKISLSPVGKCNLCPFI